MAKAQRTDKPAVDAEDDDRRDPARLAAERARIAAETDTEVAAYGEATARSLSQPDDEPVVHESAFHDEHRGLAARLLDLRKVVEDHRQAHMRDHAQLIQRVAHLDQQVVTMATRVDKEVESLGKTQRDLEAQLRESGEQVRKAGELARKMTDQVKELEELREMAADPHEVVKPLRASLATLRGDLEALGRTIDIRFEAMPKDRPRAIESRSDDELPAVKLMAELRKLKDRIAALEPD
jgi:DNA repair exonuclease SbcCD ATPase subunit